MQVVIDTDALLCLRHLGLLRGFLAADCFERIMGEYAARHELCGIQSEVEGWVQAGELVIVALSARDQALRRLRSQIDKGEAEALAWMPGQPDRSDTFFVSDDRLARRTADKLGLLAGDALDLLVLMVLREVLSRPELQNALVVWDDPRRSSCRPKDYQAFETAFERRRDSLGRMADKQGGREQP